MMMIKITQQLQLLVFGGTWGSKFLVWLSSSGETRAASK